jgi:arsenite transporter
MMYPILCKVRYEILHRLLRQRALWVQLAFSIFVNWIVAPFLMVSPTPHPQRSHLLTTIQLGLAWAFLPDEPSLRTGLILVGLGRCIAMVLIWNALAGGDNEYCAILVAVNSVLQMVLFAPLAILFINIISGNDSTRSPSYAVVATSVAVFLGIPIGAAILTRLALLRAAGEPEPAARFRSTVPR